MVNYTVTYTGEKSAYAAEVRADVVTTAGNVVNSFDTIVLLEDSIGMDELFNGASATDSAAFVIPDRESALIRVRPARTNSLRNESGERRLRVLEQRRRSTTGRRASLASTWITTVAARHP
ncbi:hypothetical protein [Rathayibacter agropyri]|uniref:hypothetical protein n=1 Tax=Rathayibacter agropyri TaxID=1634927 RepID=UPI0015636C6D|nr:hypothetical protein [Rathayibacter agropyri]NRD08870.1 hypothetical protein [Rathayibacter agropyri]